MLSSARLLRWRWFTRAKKSSTLANGLS